MTLRAFHNLFNVIRAHWFAVVVCGLLGALLATLLNIMLPVNYRASARLFLATPNWNDSTAVGEPDLKGRVYTYAFGDEYTQRRAMSYEEIVRTRDVASRVINRLGLQMTPNELIGRISARVIPDTVMIDIRARDGNAEQAARIANATAEETTNVIEELEKPFNERNSPVVPVLIEPAEVPTTPESPKTLLNLATLVVVGLAVGVTYAAVREWYKAAKVPPDLTTDEFTLSVLRGAQDIPAFADLDDVGHELAEDVRYLCLRLTSALEDMPEGRQARTLLFAAPRATDAVGTTAVLVAAGLAEASHRVAIVLTNFAEAGAPAAERGLGEVLDGRLTLADVLRFDDTGRVGVVTAGTTKSNPMAALANGRLDEAIERLETDLDYVIVIGSPVLESAEVLEIAGKVPAAVVICPVPPTTGAEMAESERLLGMARTTVLGRVVVTEDVGPDDARTDRSNAARRSVAADR